ncbi:IPTL-CTERM sorting domain-containing protein [Portibacter marinus]|uniref:IPTL-CTERM sorting domain-containing protein n=1 Tax=Portibacter marinus TaxID=2898660 RepID=UPI0038737D1F
MLSYEIQPRQTIVLVISSSNPGTVCTDNGGYQVTITGIFPFDVPTLGQWGLIILALALLIFAVVFARKRLFALRAT